VTNGNAHRVDAFLSHHGLYQIVDVVGASGELPHGKPHPTIFESVLSEAGLPPWRSVMVGDRPEMDIVGADNCGIWTCRVSRSGCEHFVNSDVSELADFECADLSTIDEIRVPGDGVNPVETVVLLAGGKGTRMGCGAGHPPKVLLDFGNGMNALEWHLRMWESFRTRRIIIVMGSGVSEIEEYI